MQPLIHPEFENEVPRHQIALLRISEGFVGVDSRKLRMQLLLKDSLDRNSPGSDQAIQLIFKNYHPASSCFQALYRNFRCQKCPFKVPTHAVIKG
jgi:hypothetical protein